MFLWLERIFKLVWNLFEERFYVVVINQESKKFFNR